MISPRYGVLSLFAFFAILALAFENYDTWTHPVKVRPEKGATKKSVEKIENPPAEGGQKESTDIQSYIFISQNNIFAPERKEFPIVAPPPPAQPVIKPIVRPKITLYGVMLADDYQSASIVDDRPKTKGERETRNVKVGDPIGEFKVAQILPDRIVMEATGDSFEVLLYDAKSPKQRTYAKTEAKPAAVTTTLPTPATVPPAVATPAVPARPPTPAVSQPTAPAQPPTPAFSRARRGQVDPNVAQQAPQQAPQPSAPSQPNVSSQPERPPMGVWAGAN
jgi:hypothetical protein